MDLKSLIRTIPNYPKEGIMFRDITTLLADAQGFKACIDALSSKYESANIDVVVGIEARGFILGGALADHLGTGFVPLRKKGKLPGKTIGQDYQLEYGVDVLEIHEDALEEGGRVLLVDDLIATGGTAEAGIKLVRQVGATVVAACFVIDLPDLGGKAKIENMDVPCHVLMEFEGD
ncbi:MAG: adenine phosphoribosyltransferase [Pseudomonadota bacterium]